MKTAALIGFVLLALKSFAEGPQDLTVHLRVPRSDMLGRELLVLGGTNNGAGDFLFHQSTNLNVWRPFVSIFTKEREFGFVDRSYELSDKRAFPASRFFKVLGRAQSPAEMLELWQAGNWTSYRYEFTRSCFNCKPQSLTATVYVRHGRVVAAENIRTTPGFPVPDPNTGLAEFKSIEELLEKIAADISRADLLAVRFHESLFYPEWIDIDFRTEVADEEEYFRAERVERLADGE